MKLRLQAVIVALIMALTMTAVPADSLFAYAVEDENSEALATEETTVVPEEEVVTEPSEEAAQAGQSTTQSVSKQDNTQENMGTYPGTFPSWPTGGEVIEKTAIDLAWPYGTPKSVYSYHGGSATPAFQAALNAVYPNRSSWGKKPKVGASCDVFTETVVRYSGYDTAVPRGLTDAFKYYKKHTEKWKNTGVCKVADMKSGDIILWKKPNVGHACVFVRINGVGYLAEAHYVAEEYGSIDKVAKDYKPSKYKKFHVYRATGRLKVPYEKGFRGNNVKRIQKFLNWAGFDCGDVDGYYGNKTEAAVKAFQETTGLKVDGKFGSQCMTACKKYIPGVTGPEVFVDPDKHPYPGKLPIVGKKGLKYKAKNSQVRKMQKFLNWYGNYHLSVDGYFGKQTRKAVRKYQKAEKLKVDGIFGKACKRHAKSIRK